MWKRRLTGPQYHGKLEVVAVKRIHRPALHYEVVSIYQLQGPKVFLTPSKQ